MTATVGVLVCLAVASALLLWRCKARRGRVVGVLGDDRPGLDSDKATGDDEEAEVIKPGRQTSRLII